MFGWLEICNVQIFLNVNNLKTVPLPTLIQLLTTDLQALVGLPGKSHKHVSSCGRVGVSSLMLRNREFSCHINPLLSLMTFVKRGRAERMGSQSRRWVGTCRTRKASDSQVSYSEGD